MFTSDWLFHSSPIYCYCCYLLNLLKKQCQASRYEFFPTIITLDWLPRFWRADCAPLDSDAMNYSVLSRLSSNMMDPSAGERKITFRQWNCFNCKVLFRRRVLCSFVGQKRKQERKTTFIKLFIAPNLHSLSFYFPLNNKQQKVQRTSSDCVHCKFTCSHVMLI